MTTDDIECDTCRDLACERDDSPDEERRERAEELLTQHCRDQHPDLPRNP